MQTPTPNAEPGFRSRPALLAVLTLSTVDLVLALTEVPRMLLPPARAYLRDTLPTFWSQVPRLLPGLIVAAALSFLLIVPSRLARLLGAFGSVVGVAFATVLMSQQGLLVPSCSDLPMGGVLAVLLGLGAGYVSRELDRGRVVLGALIVGFPLVSAHGTALGSALAARRFAELRNAVVAQGQPRVFVATKDSIRTPIEVAFVRSLRPPHVAVPIDVFQVEPESAEERWLLQLAIPGVRMKGGAITALPAQPGASSRPDAAAWPIRRDQNGLPSVEVGQASGRFVLSCITPFGAVAEVVEPKRGVVEFSADSEPRRLAGEFSRHERSGIAMWILVEQEQGSGWAHTVLR